MPVPFEKFPAGPVHSSRGVLLSEAVLDWCAEEAERGYPLSRLTQYRRIESVQEEETSEFGQRAG